MTQPGLKIKALLNKLRPAEIPVSEMMLEAELNRLGIKFQLNECASEEDIEYELSGLAENEWHKSSSLKIFADNRKMKLAYQAIVSDGKTSHCVEEIVAVDDLNENNNESISYYPDDIKCFERKDSLIYRPCLISDIIPERPTFIKELFVFQQKVFPLPEPVRFVNAVNMLGDGNIFVLLESEFQEFKKLFL